MLIPSPLGGERVRVRGLSPGFCAGRGSRKRALTHRMGEGERGGAGIHHGVFCWVHSWPGILRFARMWLGIHGAMAFGSNGGSVAAQAGQVSEGRSVL